MGLTHSGDIANIAFKVAVEAQVFKSPFEDLGLIKYARYFDDAFFLFASRSALRACLPTYVRHPSYFKILCTKVSTVEVPFLELAIRLDNGRVRAGQSFSKIPVPLCPSSAHAPHVHRAWPSAVVNRTVTLNPDNADVAVDKLHQIYEAAGAHPFTLAHLQRAPSKPKPCAPELPVVACVLPYHRVTQRSLAFALKHAQLPHGIQMRVQPSYCNGLPSVVGLTKRHNSQVTRSIDNTRGGLGSGVLSSSCITFNNLYAMQDM